MRDSAPAATVCSAATGCCALSPALPPKNPREAVVVAAEDEVVVVEDDVSSPQRGKETVQSQVRYAAWQSSQPTRYEYLSRPHASVVSAVVRLATPEMMVSPISDGSVDAVYALSGRPRGGRGIA